MSTFYYIFFIYCVRIILLRYCGDRMKIIKIGALWCPGCITINPIIDNIKKDYPNIEVKSLDIDMDEDEVKKYNIGNKLPVIILLSNNNEELTRIIGEKKQEEIYSIINEFND